MGCKDKECVCGSEVCNQRRCPECKKSVEVVGEHQMCEHCPCQPRTEVVDGPGE